MRILRDVLEDVKESPLAYVRIVGVILLTIILYVEAGKVGDRVRIFAEDIHTIAEDIRNTE